MLDNQWVFIYYFNVDAIRVNKIVAWLSLVERCVRDAEVVGSNPVASTTHRKSETNWFSGFLFAILVVMQQQKGKEKLTDQERFMKEAIRQAKKAEALEEVPMAV